MATCLIALGSNLGDRQAALDTALCELELLPRTTILRKSQFYEFPAIGGPAGQESFLNAAAVLATELTPVTVLAELQKVEARCGRWTGERWSARTLDLDLLLYDELMMNSPILVLPHPRMSFRRFVLEPAAEIAAEMCLPIIDWSIGQLLAHLKEKNDTLAIISPSHELREQLCRFLFDRYRAHKLAPVYSDSIAELWPSEDTTWISLSGSPAPAFSGEISMPDRYPKLTVLLEPDVVQRVTGGRGPSLILTRAEFGEIEREVSAAIASVWPDLG
jgi:2-amino-4-hydroxy-6-hydroxymethyldihydropteridine diphosphokinase